MCYPFFHDFRVIPSENGFQLVCNTASLFTTEARGLALIGVLPTLAGREGHWVMIFSVKEASENRLLGQRLFNCKTLLIPATGSLELALLI
jgi:hypothetical protein